MSRSGATILRAILGVTFIVHGYYAYDVLTTDVLAATLAQRFPGRPIMSLYVSRGALDDGSRLVATAHSSCFLLPEPERAQRRLVAEVEEARRSR